MITLSGIALVPGRAGGAAMLVRKAASRSWPHVQRPSDIDAIASARLAAGLELRRLLEPLPAGAAREIVQAHLALINDPLLVGEIDRHLQAGASAEDAIAQAGSTLAARFERLGDPTLRARAADLRDVCECIGRHLAGVSTAELPAERRVVCAADLSPAQVLHLAEMPPLAFALEGGAEASHAAILMRALGIPAVIGVAGVIDAVEDGDQVVVDGHRGEVFVRPACVDVSGPSAPDTARRSDPDRAQTSDGVDVSVSATIAGVSDLRRAIAAGADGVGLFRTEWLFLSGERLPSEQEQVKAYEAVAELVRDRPMTVRAADLGGDKQPPALRLPAEPNPALGLRGMRLMLAYPELLETQLRALVRAFAGRRFRLLLPMVNDPGAVGRVRELLHAIAGPPATWRFDLGVMIETPAAAVMADLFADVVDFVSIGTNDLTQYVLAADREGRSAAFQPLHPAVLRILYDTVAAVVRRGRPVAVCGEAAGDPLLMPLLLGAGVTELSVPPEAIVTTKRLVRRTSASSARALGEELMALSTAAAVMTRLQRNTSPPDTDVRTTRDAR